MDELDEFNEAPHIVHGDVILPSNVVGGSVTREQQLRHPSDVVIDDDDTQLRTVNLLDDDDEDIVLSTDDLLIGNGAIGNHTYRRSQMNGSMKLANDNKNQILT